MCIAIYKPKGITLFPNVLENSWKGNPDGAGFACIKNGELLVKKGFMKFDDFKNAYKEHEKDQAIIHFRIKTHGEISPENCHPFHVSKNMVFIHNGTITGIPTDSKKSDTYIFNELILQNLVRVYGKNLIYNKAFGTILEDFIGWSKMIFLDSSGKFKIFGENKGDWNSECWFSNSSWKDKPKYEYKDHQNQHKHNKKKQGKIELITSSPSSTPSSSKDYKIGDIVRMTFPYVPGTDRGTFGRILSFYTNTDVDLKVYFKGEKPSENHRVPLIYIEPYKNFSLVNNQSSVTTATSDSRLDIFSQEDMEGYGL